MFEIKIVHNKNGIYDVYVDGKWEIASNNADDVFDYLSKEFYDFILKFEDRYHG